VLLLSPLCVAVYRKLTVAYPAQEHMYLKHVYYYFLDGFSAPQLAAQKVALELVAKSFAGGTATCRR
jgi:hypothetical protein